MVLRMRTQTTQWTVLPVRTAPASTTRVMKPVCRLTDRLLTRPRVIWGGSHKSREALVRVIY